MNKSDVGAADYVYGSGNAAGAGDAGPHAVVSAGGNTYAYDDNGNMISGDGRTLTWTSFNKPGTVVNGTTSTRFDYGPERARIRQVRVQGAVTTTIKYAGTLFEQTGKTGAATQYVHYVFAGERRVAVYSKDTAPTPARVLRYLHQDHLGSVDTIMDESGGVVERLSYDAWGKRRTASGEDAWKDSAVAIAGATTPRGFTDHEHLDDFELVHMNGRVYEPVLGRFLSPDPLVQYPESTQGFNRYTYVFNNPLSFTDPTGYWLENLEEDDRIYDGTEDPPEPPDDPGAEGGIGGLFGGGDEGDTPPVSNPATGQSMTTRSGSPQGVNQAGHGGGGRRGMFSDYWDDARELRRDMEIQERLTQSPLPGASITKKDGETADGRFSPEGRYRVKEDGSPKPHLGVDLAAPVGTLVLAAGDGRAIERTVRGYGRVVEIYHGGGTVARYAHLDSVTFSGSARVAAGDIIGRVGTTGNVPPNASPHLHFEVLSNEKRVDPTNYFNWRQ